MCLRHGLGLGEHVLEELGADGQDELVGLGGGGGVTLHLEEGAAVLGLHLEECPAGGEHHVREQGTVAELLGRGEERVVVVVPPEAEVLTHPV